MATATETETTAYAFCTDARCVGYLQEEVPAVLTVTSATYIDHGGDLPGLESSFEDVRFANQADAECEHCGGTRQISTQVRPDYPNVSGHDPMGLFEFRGKTEKELAEFRHAREIDGLVREREMDDLRRQIQQLTELVAGNATQDDEPVKRGPGRPRKDTVDG